MSQWISRFWLDDNGQDIIEYSLLIMFIAVACIWFVGQGKPSVDSIWTSANNHITVANASANGS